MKKRTLLNNNCRIFFEWFLSIVGYGLILIAVSILFPKTIHIDNSYYGLWGFLGATIIFILNKTIKPIIVWMTIPITALTLGLFYPFINVFILHIVHFILGDHFAIHGIFMSVFIALLISFMNTLMYNLVVKPLLTKENIYE